MRMWMVDPSKMCRKHLLGEHVELHMLVGSIIRGKSLTKFLEYGLLEPRSIHARHESIVEEMLRRGYNHKSELPSYDFSMYESDYVERILSTSVDVSLSVKELCVRCESCMKRFK